MKNKTRDKFIKYILIVVLFMSSSFITYSQIEFKNPMNIKVAAASNWKPFSYINKKGEAEGVLIDFWKAWGRANEAKIEFIMTDWANTLQLVKDGKVDMHVGLFYNYDRAQYIDFSTPLIDIATGIFVQEDIKAWDIDDIKDIGIGVTKDNNARSYLQKNYPDVKLLIYENNKEIMKAVKNGEIKAISMDYRSNLKNIGLSYPELKEFDLLQTIYVYPLRAGVKKGDKELLSFIDNGMKKMTVDEFKEVQSKWEYITINITRESVVNYILAASMMIIIILLINTLFLRHKIKLNIKMIAEHEESYKTLVELCPDGIFVQCEGKIVFSNDAGVKLLGEENKKGLNGSAFIDFVHPDFHEKFKLHIAKMKDHGNDNRPIESKFLTKSGIEIDTNISTTNFTYNGKRAILSIVRNITHKKREEEKKRKIIEEEQRLLRETLEYERLKTEFFSNISHELRTPLNIILASIQLLDGTRSENHDCLNYEYYKKYSNIMKQNCYRQIRLINNLIDITRIDSGFLEMKFNHYNIVEVVENITLSVAEYIKSKGINIIFDTEMEEKIISCDGDKIERVLLNLLSNSVKFTRAGGGIYVNIYDGNDEICISVKDTGTGIPKEKQKIIFERFRQAQSLFNREREGSGIGLSLVKSIVELHDGRIYINSEYEQGSEFIIKMPVNIKGEKDHISFQQTPYTQDKVEMINIEFSDIYEL